MYKLSQGNALEVLKDLPDNSIDSLVTDPPAGIAFMGKSWDKNKGGRDEWIAWLSEIMSECLRVLKPGAHGFVWGIPRTSHWTAMALENSGFIIRDVVTHLFGSGFPKSHNISKAIDKAAGAKRKVVGPNIRLGDKKAYPKNPNNPFFHTDNAKDMGLITAPATPESKQWDGFGTALKPASEHWILVQKPLSEKTIAKNVLKWGVGGLNIDGCRVEATQSDIKGMTRSKGTNIKGGNLVGGKGDYIPPVPSPQGRFPANLVLSGDAPEMLDEQSGINDARGGVRKPRSNKPSNVQNAPHGGIRITRNDSGGASRFFYCAKASKSERGKNNSHPTVKPLKLIRYLSRLVTPPGGSLLDPFAGSGTHGVAAILEGFSPVLIERESEYIEIARARLDAIAKPEAPELPL